MGMGKIAGTFYGTVQLGGIKYEIFEVPVVERDGLILGRIEYLDQVIKLDQAMQPDKKRFALAHEIVHGILTEAGYNSETNNEQLVDALARGFLEVIDQRVPIIHQSKSFDFKCAGDKLAEGMARGLEHGAPKVEEFDRRILGEWQVPEKDTTIEEI